MTTLGHPKIFAALALAMAGAASGCLVDHGTLRPDEPDYPSDYPSAPAPSSDYGAPVAQQSYDATAADVTPGAEMNEDAFYDRLSPYGYWRTTAEYGRVWVPTGVGADFQPYSDGHWALTDWGWTYVSDAPWGWAAYHYGRWGYGYGLGWYWVPGRVWAPAWVSWRYGGGYVGWAPMGPGGYYYGAHSRAWVAVQERHFTQPIRTVAVPSMRTAGVVASMHPQAAISRPQRGGGVIAGPPVANVSRAVGQPIRPAPVAQVLPRAGVGRGAIGRAPTYGASPRTYSPRAGQAAPRAGQPVPRANSGDRWNRSVQPGGRWGGSPPPARSYGSGGYSPRSSGGGYTPRASSPGGGHSSAPKASAPSGGGGHSSGGSHPSGHSGHK